MVKRCATVAVGEWEDGAARTTKQIQFTELLVGLGKCAFITEGQHLKKTLITLDIVPKGGGRSCPKFYLEYHMTKDLYISFVHMIGRST